MNKNRSEDRRAGVRPNVDLIGSDSIISLPLTQYHPSAPSPKTGQLYQNKKKIYKKRALNQDGRTDWTANLNLNLDQGVAKLLL